MYAIASNAARSGVIKGVGSNTGDSIIDIHIHHKSITPLLETILCVSVCLCARQPFFFQNNIKSSLLYFRKKPVGLPPPPSAVFI